MSEFETHEKVNVLLIEDDPLLVVALIQHLNALKYVVTHEVSGLKADQLLVEHQYDLVIMDQYLPEMDSLEILQRLRQRGSNVPVLVLSAPEMLTDRVRGLNLGADNYANKPVDFNELNALIRALLRRASINATPCLEYNGLSLDISGKTARWYGRQLMLHSTEFALLKLLISSAGAVVSHGLISRKISQRGLELNHGAIRVFVCRLRKKLAGSCLSIRAVHGQGYTLEKTIG